jgi:hypothetical protein
MSYARQRAASRRSPELRVFFPAMKPKPPAPAAVTPQALAVAAGRKTRRVQKKLHEAEREIRSASEALSHIHQKEADEAAQRNAAAERKVQEACEELEVVKEMLEHPDPKEPQEAHGPPSPGKTGHGVRSLLEHMKPKH